MSRTKEPKVVPLEELQQSIIVISQGMKTLLSTRLRDDTLYLLIQQSIKPAGARPTLEQIKLVLINAARLEEHYLKPEPE